jgi:hypothetical protein
MRVYTKIRTMLGTHKELLLKFEQFETKSDGHDDKIMLILEYIKQFEKVKQQESELKNRPRIGFKKQKED